MSEPGYYDVVFEEFRDELTRCSTRIFLHPLPVTQINRLSMLAAIVAERVLVRDKRRDWERWGRACLAEGWTPGQALQEGEPVIMRVKDYELIIFDADGTLRRCTVEGQPCPNKPGEWELIPGVKERLGQIDWGVSGTWLGIASNQAGVACGFLDEQVAYQMLDDMVVEATGRWPPTGCVQLCPHAVEGDCLCRKPKPLMLERVMRQWNVEPSWTLFVGDMESDRAAAIAAEVDFMWAKDFFSRGSSDESIDT